MTDTLLQQAELVFRTHVHTVLPLHASLVEAMCKAPRLPKELATVLEDIGQCYCGLADQLNAELVHRNELNAGPEAEDSDEMRIDAFVERLFSGLGRFETSSGDVLDARRAVEAHPVVGDAIRTALLLAKADR